LRLGNTHARDLTLPDYQLGRETLPDPISRRKKEIRRVGSDLDFLNRSRATAFVQKIEI